LGNIVVSKADRHGGLIQVSQLLGPKGVAIKQGRLVVASKEVVDLAVIQAVIIFWVKEARRIGSRWVQEICEGVCDKDWIALVVCQKRFGLMVCRVEGGINRNRVGGCAVRFGDGLGGNPTTYGVMGVSNEAVSPVRSRIIVGSLSQGIIRTVSAWINGTTCLKKESGRGN
jgi:hypothetical protein